MGPLYVLLGEASVQVLYPFFIGLFVFLALSHMSSLYILEIKLLSEVSLASMFSRMVGSFFIFFIFLFNYCLRRVVSISLPPLPPSPAIPTSHPQSDPPLSLSMCPLYMFLDDPSPFLHFSLPPPLWLLSVCSLFQCLWYYFSCLSCFVD